MTMPVPDAQAALAAVLAGLAWGLGSPPHPAARALSLVRRRTAEAGAEPRGRGQDRQAPRVVVAAGVAWLGAWALLGGPAGAVAGTAVAAGVLLVVPRLEPRDVRQRRERIATDLPLALDLLAACLVVGRPPDHALVAVCTAVGGPLADDLEVVSARLRLGADPVRLWRDVACGPSPLAPLGRTMARSIETGAPVVDGLRLLATDLRRRRRAVVEQRARGVAVRAAAPLGLCFLPAFVLVGVVPAVVGAFSALSW